MTLPLFSELHFIAVTRRRPFTRRVEMESWEIDEGNGDWKVLRRKSD